MRGNHLCCLLQNRLLQNPNFFFPCWVTMLSTFLFISWRKEKEREDEDEKVVIRLSLLGSLVGRQNSYYEGVVTTH